MSSSESYISILIESLEMKSRVLDEVVRCDDRLKELVEAPDPDFRKIDENFREIGELSRKVERLNEGFETVYAKVRSELLTNKTEYAEEIERLKILIFQVTEKVVSIQAQEARNREAVLALLHGKRRELSKKRNSVKVANMYSNTMRGILKGDTYFMDKKK